jgi:hypothetical protein
MKKRVTHVSWDFGAIQDIATEILGYRPEKKTSKTLCKKRVSMKNIDNTNPTCSECSELLKRDPVYG